MTDRVAVAIIGAGFGGLAAAMALSRAGIDDVVILERADALGGTWRENTYPGVACDIPSHLYGFARHPNPDWSGVYARGDEIRDYLERVADAEGIRPRLSTPLLSARWQDDAWRLVLGGEDAGELIADALVLACGRLTEPFIPDVPGLESFPGPLFHTARWDHTADLAGRVAVVGTGASAVQLLPELARTAAHVTLFQRSAAWIVPRGARPYSDAERARFAERPDELAALRAELYHEGEARFASRSGDADAAAEAQAVAEAHLAAQVADPALRRALTPDYAFGCKRVLLSDEFYPAVASPRVTLEASALAAVRGSTLVAADGAEHDVDALILATGFASTQQPYAELVHGEDGTLAEHWATGMTSFGSTVVSGFPNMFIVDGPNASLGHNSSVLMMEEQAGYIARTLVSATRTLRVDPAAEEAYTAEIDRAAASTPWVAGGCRNWYVDERSHRLTLLWPGTVGAFRERLAAVDGSEFLPEAEPAPWTLVIPVKAGASGKSRLGMPAPERTALARAIALDTIEAAARARLVGEVVVVTDDPVVSAETAGIPHARVVPQGPEPGLNAAIAHGLSAAGDGDRAVLLGDLPALRPDDLDAALARAARHDRAAVADADGTGTTLVTVRRGIPLSPAFGDGSFARHVAQGCVALPIPHRSTLRHDVDTAAQLAAADALGVGPRTAARAVRTPAGTPLR